jgi:hypothetical protein
MIYLYHSGIRIVCSVGDRGLFVPGALLSNNPRMIKVIYDQCEPKTDSDSTNYADKQLVNQIPRNCS